MEVKKIVEGMTAVEVAEVIDSNFRGIKEETDAKLSELGSKVCNIVLDQFNNEAHRQFKWVDWLIPYNTYRISLNKTEWDVTDLNGAVLQFYYENNSGEIIIVSTANKGDTILPYYDIQIKDKNLKRFYIYAKAHEGEVLRFTITDISAVIQYLDQLVLKGEGDSLVYSNLINTVKNGNIYRITLNRTDFDYSSAPENRTIFSIGFRKENDNLFYGLIPDVIKGETLSKTYDVIIPNDDANYSLGVCGRLSKGLELCASIQDITPVKLIEPNLVYGTFALTTGELMDANNRVRTRAMEVSLNNNYFLYKCPQDIIPSGNAVLFLDGVYVGSRTYSFKNGAIKIPFDGTFNSAMFAFKKADDSVISDSERMSVVVYSNKELTNYSQPTTKHIHNVQVNLEIGTLADNGNPYGGIGTLEKINNSRSGLFLSLDVERGDVIVSELNNCNIYCYNGLLEFLALTSNKDELPLSTKYIKVVFPNKILKDTIISVESDRKPYFVKNGKYKGRTYPYYHALSFEVKIPPIGDVGETLEYIGGDNEVTWTNGYVYLPDNYDVFGEAVPLIIFCHGTDGFTWTQSSIANSEHLIQFLCKNGYAVADCTILTNRYQNIGIRDINVGNSLALECYSKLYQFVTSHYNVQEGAYICGKSAGGLNSAVLSYMKPFPIRACGGLAPSLDIIINMRAIGPSADINWSFGKLGIETDYTGSHPLKNPSVSQREYLVSQRQKTSGYSPMLINTIGLDTEQFYNKCLSVDLLSYESDSELVGLVDKAAKVQPFPYKIWHAVDDDAVPIATSRFYQRMVRNGGGLCILREFPKNCGQHFAVDRAENAPKVDYLCRNGELINIPVAYAELVDWFNQW